MVKTPFRFLHAADLALELPIEGIGDNTAAGAVDLFEKRLLDAPFEAARRLFQQAKAEEVDFILLSGNIVDPNASGVGPLVFLVEQFQMLGEAGIPVYWAGSEHDGPDHWPAAIYLPDNVHFFRAGTLDEYLVMSEKTKSNIPLVRLTGYSRNDRRNVYSVAEFMPDPSGLYTIAVLHGTIDQKSIQYRGIPYWALGGGPRKTFSYKPPIVDATMKQLAKNAKNASFEPETTVIGNPMDEEQLPTIVHYPGPTLGRNPREYRDYGGTLVDVDVHGIAMLTMLPTMPIRWVKEQIELEAGASMKQLRGEMQKRIGSYRAVKSRDDLMISWVVNCPSGALPTDLRTGDVAGPLLEELRTDYGLEPPICWSVSITTTLPENLSVGVYDQKTILADFLREIRQFQQQPYEPINLLPFLPNNYRELPFGKNLPLTLPAKLVTEQVLRRLIFGDSKKELTPTDEIQLTNIRKKIKAEHRQDILRTFKPSDKEKSAHEKKKIKKLKRSRTMTAKMFRKLQRRQLLVRNILREAAALGWDLLGNEADSRR